MIIETVRDLIEALQQVDPDHKVWVKTVERLPDGDVDTDHVIVTAVRRFNIRGVQLEIDQ